VFERDEAFEPREALVPPAAVWARTVKARYPSRKAVETSDSAEARTHCRRSQGSSLRGSEVDFFGVRTHDENGLANAGEALEILDFLQRHFVNLMAGGDN
jgi:hypothetical protein